MPGAICGGGGGGGEQLFPRAIGQDPSVGETGLKDAGLPGTRQGLSTWIAIKLTGRWEAKSRYFGREIQSQVKPVTLKGKHVLGTDSR